MSEDQKKMTFDFKKMPNRKEVKTILKTGKSVSGESVHPESRQGLRTARLADLEVMGNEINRANKALDDKMELVIKNTDSAISGDRLNFFAFLTYLVDSKVLPSTAFEDYQKFKVNYLEEMEKAGEFMRVKEEELFKEREELVKKAKEEGAPKENTPKIILP